MSNIRLILGDCLEKLKEIPDGSVDAVITDPPYGIGETNEKNLSRGGICGEKDYGHYEWDAKPVSKEQINEIIRISKKQLIFGANHFSDILPKSSGWIVWDKRVQERFSNDLSDCELIWTSEKKGVRIFRYLWNGLFKHKSEERFHPTQKPLRLMMWMVEKHTKEGDTVLDPFMGSGTTGVACAKLNRNFIGIEIDEGYFKIAERRIGEWKGQERLELSK